MRSSSSIVAPSAIAILSTALLCGLSGTAVSQTATGAATPLPSITIVAPKQVARPEAAADGKHSCISPDIANHLNAIGTANRSKAGACERFSNGEACRAWENLQQLHRWLPNKFQVRQPTLEWMLHDGGEFNFSATCRNIGNYKTYFECKDARLFLGARHNEAWWYCSSLLAGGKLAGEKYQVAELKRSGRR
jgi:hypothetical protein